MESWAKESDTAHLALDETATSVSEFKKNSMETVVAGEALMDRLEDIELNEMADARAAQPEICVSLDEL